jgi:hypothetical protein
MKIYFANMFGAKGLEKYLKTKIDVLAAYPAFSKSKEIEKPAFVNDLFLDSGAFTKQKHNIILEEYIEFIKRNKKQVEIYANLDVIGDARGSYKNQIRMEKAGVQPLPVFHYGSDIKWLHKLFKKYDYIALGGLVPISQNKAAMLSYLDRMWEIILKEVPDIKVHGFGVHNVDLLKRYPWYSVDASSIHMQARYGGVLTPWGYIKINPNVKSKEMEWQIKRPLEKQIIKDKIEEFLGEFTFEQAQEQTTEGTLLRSTASINYLLDLVEKIEYKPIKSQNKIF